MILFRYLAPSLAIIIMISSVGIGPGDEATLDMSSIILYEIFSGRNGVRSTWSWAMFCLVTPCLREPR